MKDLRKELSKVSDAVTKLNDYLKKVNEEAGENMLAHVSFYPTSYDESNPEILVDHSVLDMLLESSDTVREYHSVSDDMYTLTIEGVDYWSLVRKSKDDEIRELKARLAELEESK